MKKPELLCPVGGADTLSAALRGGADAVYFGTRSFNARMNARNFGLESIPSVVHTCHEKGVRVYITLNTLLTDRNLDEALTLTESLYRAECDALIVADVGLSTLIHQNFPDFVLHASTQMSGHSVGAAEFLKSRGFSRMVLAREMDRKNMATLCKESPLESEVFVHGAICASASGQCLMSSMIGDRSGNRGECAQPCRLPYGSSYPLSFRDLCLAKHVEEMLPMGIASFKIEGRMKSPEYVYTVSRIWRTLIDEGRGATEKEMALLAGIFSRSGFTDGYFTKKTDESMIGRRTDRDKAATKMQKTSFADSGRIADPIGISREEKSAEKVVLPKREKPLFGRSARFQRADQIPETDFFSVIYLPLDRFDGKRANGVILPPVIFPHEEDRVRSALEKTKEAGARHALIGNIGHFRLMEGLDLALHGDFRLNVTNSFSLQAYPALSDILVSPELNSSQIRDLRGKKNVIVYGKIPVMLLEKKPCVKELIDRTGAHFALFPEGGRYIAVNAVPFYMADKKKLLREKEITGHHFIFTTESKQEIETILSLYREGKEAPFPIKRIK